MKSLGAFVKGRRKEAKLTQEEFAERVGLALTVRSVELVAWQRAPAGRYIGNRGRQPTAKDVPH